MELRELHPDQRYLFRLAAVNASGRGEFTEALVVRTLESTAAERKPKTKKLGWSTAKAFGELLRLLFDQSLWVLLLTTANPKASDFKRHNTESKSEEGSTEQPEEIEACTIGSHEISPNNDIESKEQVPEKQESKRLERKLKPKRTVGEDDYDYYSDSSDD